MTADRDAQIAARVRSVFDAFSRGDFETALAGAHPDIEYIPPGGQSPIRGVDGMREWMQPSAFDSMALEPLEVTVAGNKVLVLLRSKVRGEPAAASRWRPTPGASSRSTTTSS